MSEKLRTEIALIILCAFIIRTFRHCHTLYFAGHHPLIGRTCIMSQSKLTEAISDDLLDQQPEQPDLEILIP